MIRIVRLTRIQAEALDLNNNNLPKDPDDLEATSKDYATECSKTHLHSYIDLIDYPLAWLYDFTPEELRTLYAASTVGILTAKRPDLFDDELNLIEQRMTKDLPVSTTGYFFRLSGASPKDAAGLVWPMTHSRQIINALITSMRVYRCFRNGIGNPDQVEVKRLYFTHYDSTWQSSHEIRVFVRSKRVTALSQYALECDNYFNTFLEHELQDLVKNVIDYIQTLVEKVAPVIQTDDMVADLYVIDANNFRLIEFNSFGYWLAAGSCLFNWNTDRDLLYGRTDRVEFRIITN
jgi:D123